MTCTESQETLSEFMDGEARPEAASSALEHMGVCTDCRAFFATAMFERSSLRRSSLPEFPPDLDRRIRRATRTWRSRMPVLRQGRLAIPLPALAVLILYLLSATFLAFSALLGPSRTQEKDPTFHYVRELPAVVVYGQSSHEPQPASERSIIP